MAKKKGAKGEPQSPGNTQKGTVSAEQQAPASTKQDAAGSAVPNAKTDAKSKSDVDPLYLRRVYPDAAEIFAFAPKPLSAIINEAIIVLDNNALLIPYGTEPSDLKAIESAFKKLTGEKRLVVPGHVAREFAKNRPEKLKTLYHQLSQRHNVNMGSAKYPLLADSAQYQQLLKAEKELDEKLKAHREALKGVMNEVQAWLWNDPVSLIYRGLFTGEVIVDPPHPDGTALSRDLAFKDAHRVPPGYKDSDKELNPAGDLLIWRTVLHVGDTRKCHVVFVSGDESNDWWYRSADVALYPRFELVEEFRRVSGGRSLHIVRLATLLEMLGLEKKTVEAVRREEAQPKTQGPAWYKTAESAVVEWLTKKGAAVSSIHSNSPANFVVQFGDAAWVAEVRLLADLSKVASKMEKSAEHAAESSMPYLLVLVAAVRHRAIAGAKLIADHLATALSSFWLWCLRWVS